MTRLLLAAASVLVLGAAAPALAQSAAPGGPAGPGRAQRGPNRDGQCPARPLDRPLRRLSALRPGEGLRLQAGDRGGDRANRREIAAIADNPAPPTFENTIAALEKSGQALARVTTVYGIWGSNLSTPEYQKVQDEMDPKLAAFSDEITQNAKLFARIEAVYNSPEKAKLTPEQQRLVWVYWNNAVLGGARLDAAGQDAGGRDQPAARRRSTPSSARTCRRTRRAGSPISAPDDLAGLPDSVKAAAAAAAEAHGHKGEWAITNTRSSMEPFLTYSDRRDLREKVWRTYYSRGDNDDAHDNKAIITEILKLRYEKAKLLGFPTLCALEARRQDGQDAGPGDGPDDEGLARGGGARAPGGRRHAGDRRPGEAPASRSSPGTIATTPRRCARRSTTSITPR